MESAKDSEGRSDLFRGATFMPDDDSIKVDMLLESVSRNRYTTFVTVYMELRKMAPEVCDKTGFSDSVLEIMGLPSSYRRELASDPAFLIWLNLTMAVTNRMLTGQKNQQEPLRKKLIEFSQIRSRFDERKKNQSILKAPGTQILVQRFDIDPLIASTTPSHEFPPIRPSSANWSAKAILCSFFKDVVTVALERIRKTWPEEHEQFARLVKVLGYLTHGKPLKDALDQENSVGSVKGQYLKYRRVHNMRAFPAHPHLRSVVYFLSCGDRFEPSPRHGVRY